MAVLTTKMLETSREMAVRELEKLLADTYTLYLKTHGYHWNVTGPQFHSLHTMFETQYRDMWAAVDVIAERIRALGAMAPQSYLQMGSVTSIDEDPEPRDAAEMVRRLAMDHETLIAVARSLASAAEAADDLATVDLATERIEAHQKMAWMLRASRGSAA